MILLTRLDGREVVVNTDLIVTVERTPDTVLALTTGDRIMVKEPVEEVIERVAAFKYRVLCGPGHARAPGLAAVAADGDAVGAAAPASSQQPAKAT
jgi:flagellar protein FlbD